MSEEKTNPKTLSRREFLRNAGIVVGTTTVGSAFFLTACGEEKEITKTVTTTAPGTTNTVTTTAPGTTGTVTATQLSTKYMCPVCNGEFESINALKSHFETYHPWAGQIILKSSHIEVDPELCRGCHRCEMACSLYHTDECSVFQAGLTIDVDNFDMEFSGYACAQCDSPSCYNACPLKDKALCIDEATGVRYVNQENCNGCGLCVAACPFDVPRINVDMSLPIAQRNAFKCDLCRDRPEGPICVETCSRDALKLVNGRV
ncbi:MAG: 4Fe-4S dicluster domain-containing protein [Limnochordia bacterium]|nr:4Fe-4S dicluster domain-containing protein [Limnochordia bacterium]